MSCQQISRFINSTPTITNINTTTTSTVDTAIATSTSTITTIKPNTLILTSGAEADTATATVSLIPTAAIAASTALSAPTSTIATSLTAATAEDQDPYVFSETVHATPPIHFNAQKSRIRHVESAALTTETTATLTDKDTTTITTTAHVNCSDSITKSRAVATTTTSATTEVISCNAVPTVTTTITSTTTAATLSTFKHGVQQQVQRKRQHKSKSPIKIATTTTPPVSPPLTKEELKLMSPNAGLQLTPSLWQTPLLLETTTTTVPSIQPAHSPIINNNGVPTNSPMHSPTTRTANTMYTNIQHSATPLPPSNFHHTTLAQHLQKVECIKKPPKRQPAICFSNQKIIMTSPITPLTITTTTTAAAPPTTTANAANTLLPPLQPLQKVTEQIQLPTAAATTTTTILPTEASTGRIVKEEKQQSHSATDLNEIPVNVIFRKQQTAVEATTTTTETTSKTDTHKKLINKAEEVANEQAKVSVTPVSMSQQQQHQQQQQGKILTKPTLIMPCTKVDIEAAVSTLQNMQLNALKEVQQQQQQQEQQEIETQNICIQKPANKEDKSIDFDTENLASHKKLRGKQTCSLQPLIQNNLAVDHGRAVAIVKVLDNEMNADITQLSKSLVLPYCLQKHWVNLDLPQKETISREERIAQHKNILRHRALQILSTQNLQKMPIIAARKRLMCVDNLLRKYDQERQHKEQLNHSKKLCQAATCRNRALEMATHCWQHITLNNTQQIFKACCALDKNNSICGATVFDIVHDIAFCPLHENQRALYEQKLKENNKIIKNAATEGISIEQQQQQKKLLNDLQIQIQQQPKQQCILQQQVPQLQKLYVNNNNNHGISNNNNNANCIKLKQQTTRKRKVQLVNDVARAQKRGKKCAVTTTTTIPTATTPICRINTNNNNNNKNLTKAMIANTSIMLSSVASAPSPPPPPLLQRKSSTTSLESIGSASYNSASPPQHCYSYYTESSHQQHQQQQQQVQQKQEQHQKQTSIHLPPYSGVPALAPLSFGLSQPNNHHNNNNNSNNNNNNHTINNNGPSVMFNGNLNATVSAADLKEHEINQIVSQFTMLHSNNNSSNNSNIAYTGYNNNTSNLNFLNTNSDSNFTSALSTDELLTQDMLSICENSSAYASSEDTGLGGLSETELIAANDEDIPLGDTRLLEEHDLANVLSTLPDDAFNELFTTVRQDERDEVERALELADKHLKSLQQTIVSGTSESDFLGDFLDVNDEILADTDDICGNMDIVSSVINSPETSTIDTNAMYIDNSSGGMSTHSTASGTSSTSSSAVSISNNSCNSKTLTDMRGLVRT